MKFLLRRLIRALLLMAGVSVLCFLFTEMAPGSFFDEMRLNPQISPETIASLRLRYGLDEPLATRYVHWVKGAVRADFGYSTAYNSPVAPLLWERAKNTLLLTTVGMAFTWALSLPIGIWSASRHDRLLDRVVNAGTSLLISIPEVVIGLTLLAIVVRWRILPVGGIHSLESDGLSRGARVLDTGKAISRLIKSSATQFDPEVVRVFIPIAEKDAGDVFEAAGTSRAAAL